MRVQEEGIRMQEKLFLIMPIIDGFMIGDL